MASVDVISVFQFLKIKRVGRCFTAMNYMITRLNKLMSRYKYCHLCINSYGESEEYPDDYQQMMNQISTHDRILDSAELESGRDVLGNLDQEEIVLDH
jgi:hypothetical protein